jgi:hypothetical protein
MDTSSRFDNFNAGTVPVPGRMQRTTAVSGQAEAEMDAKQAIKAAKEYVNDVFEDEGLMNLGLEEVKFKEHENCWEITLGFSRPWNTRNIVAALQGEAHPQRTYKVVIIKDDSGDVVEIRNREVEEAR